MNKKPYNIELHIEELVLHGFATRDRDAIGAAVQHELTRLCAEQGMHPALSKHYEVEKLDGGSFAMKPGAKAQTIGVQVAQSVYGGLGK